MQRNKKIIFISHSHYFNGAEICLLESVRSLVKHAGIAVHVVVPGKEESHLVNELKKTGAVIHRITTNPRWVDHKLPARQWIRWMKETVRSFMELRQLLKKEKPDMVVSNSVVNSPGFAIAARLSGCRFAWYIHELGDLDHGYSFYAGKKITFWFIKLMSHKIVFNSLFTLKHFMGNKTINAREMAVIDYVVDSARLLNGSGRTIADKFGSIDTWEILVAGRTSEGKGQEDLVRAAGLLKNKYGLKNFHVTILGRVAGAYTDKLLGLIEQDKLAGLVDVIRFIDEPAVYYQKAHIGVTTSRNEAFGRITVEYMKSNMITIGANAGGTAEIITDQVNGILYKVRDHEELADILHQIISGKTDVQKLQQSAFTMSHARFNEEKHAAALGSFLFS